MRKEQIQQINTEGRGRRTVGLIVTFLVAVVATVLLWGAYLGRVLFDYDVLDRDRSGDSPLGTTALLIAAAVVTVLAVIWIVVRIRRLRYLPTHGRQVRGKIIQVSDIDENGLSPTTVRYSVDGRDYKVRKNLLKAGVAVGRDVLVIYDPKDPQKAKVELA